MSMTLLSRKTDYALLILAYLHAHPEGGCARSIAECYGLSRAFVANILKELCQKHFVTSHRGVKGGYVLARLADEISLAELLDNLEDGFRLASCTGHSDSDAAEDCVVHHVCPIKGPIAELHRRLLELLRSVTIADLFTNKLEGTTFQPILSIMNLPAPCTVVSEG
jgi:Rrf2 family protein